MDRVDGQFYTVYEDGYNKMTTVPMAEWSADGRAQTPDDNLGYHLDKRLHLHASLLPTSTSCSQ